MPRERSVRMPDENAARLRAIAHDEDRTVLGTTKRACEECLPAVRVPGIVFVTRPGGGIACWTGRPSSGAA